MGRSRAPTTTAVASVLLLLLFGSLLTLPLAAEGLAAAGPHSFLPQPALPPGAVSWPTYMGNVERTGANHLESTIAPSNVSELRPLWSLRSDGSDFSAPIVDKGTVYFGSWNGYEYAVNETSGTVLWSTFLGTDTACGGYTPMGISSTPAFLNGTLYLGGGDGYWYALNASSGAVEWRVLPGSEADGYYAWASALVYHGALYIGTASCFDNPLVPAGLLEVNLSGTHAVEHFFNSSPPGQVGESIWPTPAVNPATNTIWVATGNENPPAYPRYANAIVGLNATTLNVAGSWQVPNVEGQDADFGSTPTLISSPEGPLVVATDKNGVAYALNQSNVSVNGTWFPAWNLSTGGGFSGGAFDGATLYLAGGSSVYAVDPANGSVNWTANMVGGGYITGSLAWANGLVYAGGGSEVEAIDAANGTVLWNASLPGDQQTVTEPVVADGELFVASGDYGSEGFLTAYGLPGSTPFHVQFQSVGLPAGRPWSVSLGGVTQTSTSGTISFAEANGSFPYLVRGPGGWAVGGLLPPAGSVNVSGSNATLEFTFARGPTFGFSFSTSGLPPRTPWCVSFAGWTGCSVHGGITVRNLTAGTYGYATEAIPGYTALAHYRGALVPTAGTLSLTRGTTIYLKFTQVTYPVVFSESGLRTGTHWAVKVSGLVHGRTVTLSRGSVATTIVFDLPNGSFNFTIKPVEHYGGNFTSSVLVNAGPSSVNVTFAPDPPQHAGGPTLRTAASTIARPADSNGSGRRAVP